MNLTITARDKVLLKWLSLVLAFAAFWQFVWTPLSNHVATQEENKALYDDAVWLAKQTLPQYSTLETALNDQRAALETRFAGYFDELSAAQAEAFLVPLIRQHNGRITYFQVTTKAVVVPTLTLRTREALSYRIKELVDTYNGLSPAETELPTTESELVKSQISYVIEIAFDDYLALTDTIDALGLSIIVVGSTYSTDDALATLLFDLYSMVKLTETSP
jgi:hypothetical protein